MKIKNYLFQSIDRTIMETILDKNTTKTLTIANKMKAHEERMGQNVIVEKILRSMIPGMNCHSGNARDEQALKVSYGERRVQTMLSSMKKKRCSSCLMLKSTTRNEKMCGSSTRVAAITCAGISSGSLTLMRLSNTQ
ncbi:hypothetical protein AAG906_012280 [Vitis piasezkii]